MISPDIRTVRPDLPAPSESPSYPGAGPSTIGGLDALQSAFRSNPEAFQAFVSGIAAATLQKAAPNALSAPAATLAEVIKLYSSIATCKRHTAKNNVLALLKMLERVHGQRLNPAEVSLNEINKGLVFRFQETLVADYTKDLPDGPERRIAVDLALRTSRSVITQARSLFSAKGVDLIERYLADGMVVPDCVREFLRCKVRGQKQKTVYKTASPQAIDRAFTEIEAHRYTDTEMYIAFWLAVGAGLRASEIRAVDWSWVVERDGAWRITGGLGKNGLPIDVQVQQRATNALREFRKPSGRCCDYHVVRRLNAFLRAVGFDQTQKVAHELRALIASKLWTVSPQAAQVFCRHASIVTTEKCYTRYATKPNIPEVL